MKLKPTYPSMEDVPEALKDFYVAKDGKAVLDGFEDTPDGFVPKAKLDEFRTTNVDLMKELADFKEKYKDIDPDDVEAMRAAKKELDEIKEKDLIDKGKIDEVVEQRVEARVAEMQKDFTGKITALTKRAETAEAASAAAKDKLSGVLLHNAITDAVEEVGRPARGAVADITARAKNVWRVEDDGSLVAYDGEEVRYGKDGQTRLSMGEWLGSLADDAPHLFEPSSGGGGRGSDKGGDHHKGQHPKTIPSGDPVAFGKNLKEIASGEVTVRQN